MGETLDAGRVPARCSRSQTQPWERGIGRAESDGQRQALSAAQRGEMALSLAGALSAGGLWMARPMPDAAPC